MRGWGATIYLEEEERSHPAWKNAEFLGMCPRRIRKSLCDCLDFSTETFHIVPLGPGGQLQTDHFVNLRSAVACARFCPPGWRSRVEVRLQSGGGILLCEFSHFVALETEKEED